ncbi:late secretory pathway protein AVL9 [Phanerochaete sordida]|uniref:Late secretory pathway protein AVL9 n=1 Tax=Phanerochaete sordida TaxID=48140 RepID=A0A9P3LDT8_9APHY|nr:late secretory pathway protein AVL9 [Phanerochaete sordida]
MTTPPTLDVLSPTNSHFLLNPELEHDDSEHSDDHLDVDFDRSDGDTASQRSISLSSPPRSPRQSVHLDPSAHDAEEQEHGDDAHTPVNVIRESLSFAHRDSHPFTLDTDLSSEQDAETDDRSSFMRRLNDAETPLSSAAPSVHEKEEEEEHQADADHAAELAAEEEERNEEPAALFSPPPSSRMSYPPPPLQKPDSSRASIASFASGSTSYSRKARPESMLVTHTGPLVLGIALVDFNHLVGPKIEFARGSIFDDEELSKILPFLALPDGAHLTVEDYSYFHLVPSSPNPSTIFGISCNRQIRSADLLVKDQDVTRSTVQKAVVVLASKPVFGPIRDRLGVVTKALFAQRDFTDMTILDEFQESLELSLRSQLTESGLYMGTSLRELVHTFRQRTLILLKALMLQKKIMFYGHPVEKLCTYQYSLVTLVPGLLQHLDDCGSPPLAERAKGLSRPTELRTSDPKSMMAYVGLPLDLFGKDAFFQPYLPLQQLDMLKDTRSWLCGTTNSIVTQQKEVDLLVNLETGAFEFRNPALERVAGLTPADRKWMDDVVKDVNESFDAADPSGSPNIQFKGSDDYLRQKFDEYISGALSCVKYSDFVSKGVGAGVMITDGAGNPNAINDFNMLWIAEFKKTNAYEVWERVTDPLLFDIMEPRHPCTDRPSVLADVGLRLSEGIQELKLDQRLAPTGEAISKTFNEASTGFFKAVDSVRGRWMQRAGSSSSGSGAQTGSSSGSIVDVTKSDAGSIRSGRDSVLSTPDSSPQPPAAHPSGIRPLSLSANKMPVPVQPAPPVPTAAEVRQSSSSWGASIGSFFAQRSTRFSVAKPATPPREASPAPSMGSVRSTAVPTPTELGVDELQPKNLDEAHAAPPRAEPAAPKGPARKPSVGSIRSDAFTLHSEDGDTGVAM